MAIQPINSDTHQNNIKNSVAQDSKRAFVVHDLLINFIKFCCNRTLKASSPAADSVFSPRSAMSSSLWHKAGRGHAISPSPTLMTIRSASEDGASLQKESSYSSLQGHADETNRTPPHSKSQYPCINAFDYNEGTVY